MRTAIEALTQKPQSPDKKIAFWTAYKSLADEFDKEIQEKYKNDLDTTLIFAGLFSAVSSAFIIQIQPELQPDPTKALLALLVQNITGLPPALLPPGTSTSEPLASSVVVAQSLLYFSLFTTLMAALLAVLGKQWLLHYNLVGERGTIAERGLERQRKFDGMCQWRFDLVMQIFPLVLQVSLLLFLTALSIYLWTIHTNYCNNYSQPDWTGIPPLCCDGHFCCVVTGFTIPNFTQPLFEDSSGAILCTGTLASVFSKPLDTPGPSPPANASCPFAVLEYLQWCRYQNNTTAASISHF
ncbi:hypothetical protein B0H14DRAFT_2407625 [Mycena olivaceomarginata]|nr:hypothetical protein B0H14DRAFT_2407625 [Mycena olivaceomarginata]